MFIFIKLFKIFLIRSLIIEKIVFPKILFSKLMTNILKNTYNKFIIWHKLKSKLPLHTRAQHTCDFLRSADGSFSTSAGLKIDLRLPLGEASGLLPLEKLDVEVADPLDVRLSILLELSSSSVRGASWVSAEEPKPAYISI